MKIEKLYTLSQFVDEIPNLIQNCDLWYYFVDRYNAFIKQPLKKEMFVNEVEKPESGRDKKFSVNDASADSIIYHEDWHRKKRDWLEAEKKVIFENVELKSVSTVKHIWINNKKLSYGVKTGKYFYYLTLKELAEATNGELEINIDL